MNNAQQLMDQACELTGLSDFGEPAFLVGLNHLVDAIERETVTTEIGAAAVPSSIIQHLSNRLQVENCYRQHPEIDNEVIKDPVFITGLPRTGSTVLGHMLALDTNTRSLRGWEAAAPCPPPNIHVKNDPRIAAFEASIAFMDEMAPGIREAIPRNPTTAPEECFTLLNLSFNCVAMNGFYRIPSYDQWVMTENMVETEAAYRYHRRVLKLLQWKTPAKRWVLRTPVHSAHMGALLKTYPDARFVVTHRQPEKVLPSITSLIYQVHEIFIANITPQEMGPQQLDQWAECTHRLMRDRKNLGEDRFFDIYHREQIIDPLPALRSLYQWLGWEFTTEFNARLNNWQKENPKGKHKPDPNFFGLDLTEINDRFASYRECFGERL